MGADDLRELTEVIPIVVERRVLVRVDLKCPLEGGVPDYMSNVVALDEP